MFTVNMFSYVNYKSAWQTSTTLTCHFRYRFDYVLISYTFLTELLLTVSQ